MARYIGCDAHKKEIAVCVVDSGGQVLERRRVACTREAITAWAEQALTREDHVVLEATFHTWAIVDLLVPFVQRVVVSNPLRTQAIAAAKIKTDSVDAETLAQLLRSDYIPEVWIPDPETRRHRQLTHRRAALVADRTALKNRIHAVLAARLVPSPWADLFGPQGLRWLREVALDATGRAALDSDASPRGCRARARPPRRDHRSGRVRQSTGAAVDDPARRRRHHRPRPLGRVG